MIGITMIGLRFIEQSEEPLIVRCRTETLLRIVKSLAQLGSGSSQTVIGRRSKEMEDDGPEVPSRRPRRF
jgi:hypothetical protein